VKKILIGFSILFSFLLGLTLSPFPPVKFDPLSVSGVNYGRSEGTFVLKGETVRIKRMYSPSGLKFLQEPDGTIHLYIKKGELLTLQKIRNNQASGFFSLRVLYYTVCLLLQDLKHTIYVAIAGEESQILEIVAEGK